jgi:hypothetical protein
MSSPQAHQRMVDWLLRGPVRLPSGAYLSWVSDDASAYLYPEASAIAVRVACWWASVRGQRDLAEATIPTLHYLASAVDRDGLVWRGETAYLFDTLLVLSAFETARRADVSYNFPDVIDRLSRGAHGLVTETTAARDPKGTTRWSTRFGPHLLKPLALALLLEAGSAELRHALAQAVPLLAAQQSTSGAFVHPAEERPYLHAHCYALEGLTLLGSHTGPLTRGLAFLAGCRRLDGGYPGWPSQDDVLAADVTSQAGRLLLLSGDAAGARVSYGRLLRLQQPSGALHYSSCCAHENSWATAFAAQLGFGLEAGNLPSFWMV